MSRDQEEELELESNELELEDLAAPRDNTEISQVPNVDQDTASVSIEGMRKPLDRNATVANEEPPSADAHLIMLPDDDSNTVAVIESQRPSVIRPSTTPSGRPSDAARELVVLKRERNAKEREVLELRQQLHQKELALLEWQDKEAEFDARLVDLEARLEDANDQLTFKGNELQNAQHKLDNIEADNSEAIQKLKRQLGERTMKEAELEGQLQKASTELRAKRVEVNNANLRMEKLEDEMAADKEQLFILEEHRRSQEEELAQTVASLSTANQKVSELQTNNRNLSTQCEQLSSNKTEIQRQFDSVTAQAKAFQEQLTQTRQTLRSSEKEVRSHEKNKEKALQALEVFLGILRESGYDQSDD